jgi:hypothetical protein
VDILIAVLVLMQIPPEHISLQTAVRRTGKLMDEKPVTLLFRFLCFFSVLTGISGVEILFLFLIPDSGYLREIVCYGRFCQR